MSPEEVFAVCFHYFDIIKESPMEAMVNTECLWEDVLCECREYAANEEAERENVETATGIVLYALCLCFLVMDSSFYRRLYKKLMAQLNNGRGTLMKRLQEPFFASLDTIGAEPLSQFMNEYMESAFFISDEIEELLYATDEELMTFSEETLKIINDKVKREHSTGAFDVHYRVKKNFLLTKLYHLTENWTQEGVIWRLLYDTLTEQNILNCAYAGFVQHIVCFHFQLSEGKERENFASKIRMNKTLSNDRNEWDDNYIEQREVIKDIIEKSLARIS